MAKILVVDDDKDILELMLLLLGAKYYKVVPLNNAGDFMAALKLTAFDLIIMDINLSGYDGREICRMLKMSQLYKNIPVILYSAGDISPGSVKKSMANEFLPKPFDVSKLYDLIDGYVDRNQLIANKQP